MENTMRGLSLLVTLFLVSVCPAFAATAVNAVPDVRALLTGPAAAASLQETAPGPNGPDGRGAVNAQGKDLYPEIRVRVTSPRHTVLSSQTPGIIATVSVRDGVRFAKGQALLEMDPTFERIQLKKAQANLRRHELILRMTKEQVALQTKGQLELEMVKADILEATAEVDLSKTRLERMRVTSPYAGRVGAVMVRELQFVAEGQPLLEIIDDSDMELEFIVSSQWLRWFKPGREFEVSIDETGKRYQAVLERIGGKVDPLSRSVTAYAKLKNPDPDLMEGMSGEAFILSPQKAGQ